MKESRVMDRVIECGIVTMFFAIVLCAFGLVGYYETHYVQSAEVVAIEGDEVVVVDEVGEVWAFLGDDYNVGQIVRVTFDTNCTDNTRYDDIITRVR